MAKRLLLVDDEKFFLEGLQDGLSEYEDVFTTDICFSVDEAIKLNGKDEYDLIVTDIRMPKKSGLELFDYLREHDFKGGILAMTAYGSEEVFEKIKKYGGLDVILKPFDFTWFKDRLMDIFSKDEEEGVSGTIDSINLTSILQMINLEKKSLIVRIAIENSQGFLYFEKGEMVHAEYEGLEGEEAALHLVKLNKGQFSLLKSGKRVHRTINTPFLALMINIMKVIDENIRDQGLSDLKKDEGADADMFNKAIDVMKDNLGDALISCSIWASADGEPIATYDPDESVDSEAAATLFNQVSAFIKQSLKGANFPVELNRYYIMDLTDNKIALAVQLGDFQWGMLIDTARTSMGLVLNIALPEAMALFQE